ncbi:uncharacterized protein DNG_00936 [Cephalotrichum gorgonifer]|uniref:rRNA methyltransferase 1, mitochondrial n=1 Tax=Cephalotrichum gorgonifer TaxID=2041049 RepID=A0AAE8SR88_9PEZI|nr:uncharacterized protein DNG_00936 [Cephalotrichum gorgonifer]
MTFGTGATQEGTRDRNEEILEAEEKEGTPTLYPTSRLAMTLSQGRGTLWGEEKMVPGMLWPVSRDLPGIVLVGGENEVVRSLGPDGRRRANTLNRGEGTTGAEVEMRVELVGRGLPENTTRARPACRHEFLFGSSVVTAALTTSRRKLYHLYILEGGKRGPEGAGYNSPRALAERRGVPITMVKDQGAALLEKMSGGRPHNGYVLEASPLPQLPVTSLGPPGPNPWKPEFEVVLGRQSREDEAINGTGTTVHCQPKKNQKPLVLLLNEVLDPANLGAMIRSAWFLGASAVAITAQGSATLTPVALKASAGAAEEMPILSVESAMDFITASKEAGWKSYAAAPAILGKDKKKTTIKQLEEQNPLAESPCILILGSEGQGLPKPLRRAADFEISIPGASRSSVDSLNVSVAGGILCNAFLNPHPAGSAKGSQSKVAETDEVEHAEGEVEEKQPGKSTDKGGLF